MHAIVINIIIGVFVWIEFVLAIHPIEANIGTISRAVWELPNVASSVCLGAIAIDAHALVSLEREMLFVQHFFQDVLVVEASFSLRSPQLHLRRVRPTKMMNAGGSTTARTPALTSEITSPINFCCEGPLRLLSPRANTAAAAKVTTSRVLFGMASSKQNVVGRASALASVCFLYYCRIQRSPLASGGCPGLRMRGRRGDEGLQREPETIFFEYR